MKIVEFGDEKLRQASRQLNARDINRVEMQNFIKSMFDILETKKLGVGIAAPQLGKNIPIFIVKIQQTKYRKNVEPMQEVFINPAITKVFGNKKQLYEGCISAGKNGLFAKVPRYKKIEVKYIDNNGKIKNKIFEGLAAHIIQHEVDHLNGILFVDKVKDTTSYKTYKQYLKYIKNT